MNNVLTLRNLLLRRLAQPEPFEVYIGTNAQRFFQAPVKAVHADCIELGDGTFVMFDKVVTLRIIEK